MTCIRYFLSPAGDLVERPESGRCDRFWSLWGSRLKIEHAIAARPGQDRLAQLRAELIEANDTINAHLEVCPTCRSWMDRADEIGVEGWLAVLHREHREEQYLNPFGLRPGVKQISEVTA
jgi:hypothetical protein